MSGIDSKWISILRGTISIKRLVDFPEKFKTILAEHPEFIFDESSIATLSGDVNKNPDWKDRICEGSTKSILRMVVEKDNPDLELLEQLLSSDIVNVNLLEEEDRNELFISSFMWVCGTGKKVLAEKFLQCPKLDINQEAYTDHYTDNTTNALNEALVNRHWEIARLILEHPEIDPNRSFGSEGQTPLFKCVYGGAIEGVKLLLSHPKIDVNKESNYHMKGRTPLFLACQRGFLDIIRLLLDNGADPTVQMEELSSICRGYGGSISRTVNKRSKWTRNLLDHMKELLNPKPKDRYQYKSWYKEGLRNYPEVINILQNLPKVN